MLKPDVLGFTLDDAKSQLENSGYQIEVVMTKPPRGNPIGIKRVVNVAVTSEKVVLTVACEEEGKGGVLNGL